MVHGKSTMVLQVTLEFGSGHLANIKIQNKQETASAAKVHKRVKFVKLR